MVDLLNSIDGGSHDIWLEVYKLPKDTWLPDLEAVVTAIKKKEEKEKQKEEAMSEMVCLKRNGYCRKIF